MEKDLLIKENITIKDALKKLDTTAEKVLLVVDNNKRLLGTLTDGDIRRFILKGNGLEELVLKAYHKNSICVNETYNLEDIKEIMINNKIDLIPVVDKSSVVVNYLSWEKVFLNSGIKRDTLENKIDIPVVIMAGGKGTRLEPYTKILPKPLIPIGDKTILERIISEFLIFGINNFYLTLNYKGQMIEAYFNSIEKAYNINFFYENDFFGTAGSLKLINDIVKDDFIVSNCDIIVKANYNDVYKLHKSNNSYITILTSIQHYKIPYGIVEYKSGGEVYSIKEKPEYSFNINTGVYLLNKKALKYIPGNKSFHMTDLINELIKNNLKVIIYPVNESDYLDIGQWEEYKKNIELLNNY